MGRSGFTDEGGASMMSWLLDSASCTSTQQDRYDRDFEDPAYLRYLEGDFGVAEAAGQKYGLEAKLAELEAELLEEKRKNKDRILLECELAYQDQLIEELEGKIEEKQKMICGLEVMLEAEKRKNKDRILLECELAYQDQLIEELEGKIEEKQKMICGLEVMLEAEKKKNFDEVKCFAVASFSVAVTLAAVLYCVYDKML